MTWKLKNMGVNGQWWIRRADVFVLSVAANKAQHRHHPEIWWRIKCGSHTLLEGESTDVESAQKAVEQELHRLAKSVLKELDL